MRNYILKEISESTNTDLKKIIYSSAEPVFDVISAEKQLSGRGRLGRSFFSPDGGLYFSAAYPIEKNTPNISFLTLLAGLSAAEALKELTGENIFIKWPNDLYINGRKLCGILTELINTPYALTAVVGIGINLNTQKSEIPTELKGKMTSLRAENICPPEKTALMKRTVEILDYYVYEKKSLVNISDEIINKLNELSFLKDKTVYYNGKRGICSDINPDGSIKIIFGDKEENIFFGEITF